MLSSPMLMRGFSLESDYKQTKGTCGVRYTHTHGTAPHQKRHVIPSNFSGHDARHHGYKWPPPSRPAPAPTNQTKPSQRQTPKNKPPLHAPVRSSSKANATASVCKVAITIPSLVWLRRTVRRWRFRAAAAEAGVSSSSGKGSVVPAGHVAVRVESGGDGGSRRFVVRVAHLGHPVFRELLRRAEEEYGFPAAPGPIALPCDEDHFLDVLHRVSSSSTSSSSCCCGPALKRRGDSRPLLQGMDVEKKLVC